VKASLVSPQGGRVHSLSEYGYADATSGFLILPQTYFGYYQDGKPDTVCSFGFPLSSSTEVVIEVEPTPNDVTQVNASGITETVQVSWVYRYVFGGLAIQL
jgi:hypothetical protein